jgi:hypothetical protein
MSFRLVRRTAKKTIYSIHDVYYLNFTSEGFQVYEKDRLLFTGKGDRVNLSSVINGILVLTYAEREYLTQVKNTAKRDGICIPEASNAPSACFSMMENMEGLTIYKSAFPNLTYVKKQLDREDTRFYEMGCRTTYPVEYISFEGSYIPFSVEKYMQMLERLTKDGPMSTSDFIHVIGASIEAATESLTNIIKKLEKSLKYMTVDFEFGSIWK